MPRLLQFHQALVLMLKFCGPHFEKQASSEPGLELSLNSSVASPLLGSVGDIMVIETAPHPGRESGKASCRR